MDRSRATTATEATACSKSGKQVLVTGRELVGREEIVVDGESRWVTAGYLADEKPLPPSRRAATAQRDLQQRHLPSRGVSPNIAERCYRSVCDAFPQITSYGGCDAHGEHASGTRAGHHDQRRPRWQRSPTSSGPTPPS